MKKLLILPILFILSCSTEPEDCAGVAGGNAEVDMCGVCDRDPTNDCVQDCAGVWGGNTLEDCAGKCGIIENINLLGNCYNISQTTSLDLSGTQISSLPELH